MTHSVKHAAGCPGNAGYCWCGAARALRFLLFALLMQLALPARAATMTLEQCTLAGVEEADCPTVARAALKEMQEDSAKKKLAAPPKVEKDPIPVWNAAPTFSHGPMAPLLRIGFNAAGKAVIGVNGALAYSLEFNFARDAIDPKTWWLSLVAFGSAGIGPSALDASKPAFGTSIGGALGIYNCTFLVGVGVELFDIALSPEAESSGLLISPRKANLFYMVGVGKSFAL